jgi:hypothetical protein
MYASHVYWKPADLVRYPGSTGVAEFQMGAVSPSEFDDLFVLSAERERIHKRLEGVFGFAKEVEEVRNVPLQTVTPTPGTACAPLQFHLEYGAVSNPGQLVPGIYQLKVEAIICGKEERKKMWFNVDTCGFNGTIVVDF